MGWFDDVRERADVGAVLAEMGATRRRDRWTPCPVCGEAATSKGDRRGPVRTWRKGAATGWACMRGGCGHAEDVVATVARAAGYPEPRAEDWGHVQAWAAARGLCPPREGWAAPEGVRMKARRSEVERPREYASATTARRVWDRALPVDRDPAAVAWLADRVAREGDGDAEAVLRRVVATDLARVLPVGAEVPRWARCQGYPWSANGLHDGRGEQVAAVGAPVGWRLLLRAWGADGELAGLRARSLWVGDRHDAHRKEIAPIGGTPPGSVYACGLARALLQGRVVGAGAAFRARDREVVWSGAVVIREGGPDWLLSAGSPAAAEGPAVATIGIWAGAWVGEGGAALAGRLRAAGTARVLVATDPDEAGRRYAGQIGSALALAGVPWEWAHGDADGGGR